MGRNGPMGAGGTRPMVLRRGDGATADACPTTSLRQRDSNLQAGGQSGDCGSMATRSRWSAPPRSRPGDARAGAPGVLDNMGGRPSGGASAAGGPGGADGNWTQGLSKIQRKRIRQRERQRALAQASAHEGGGREADDEEEEDDEDQECEVDEDEQRGHEPVRPYQPPPLPRRLCVQQAEQLQKKVERMQLEGSRPQLLQSAERRLEEARKLVREAGGPTERRLVFSILQEETKERRLRESLPRAAKAVEDKEAELREAQQALEDARRRKADLEAKWNNSKARVAFLASEKAAETVPQEQTTAVHEALQALLLNAPPAMQAQARMVSDYFRAVAPIPARLPEDKYYELSDGETQDEGQAMEGIEEHQRQGIKRGLRECQERGAVLPPPARAANSLEEAQVQVARIRHQKLAAISAAFDKGSASHEQVPTLAPGELADRFDQELQRAMEEVRVHAAAKAEGRDPTPCAQSTMVPQLDAKAAEAAASEGKDDGEGARGGKTARTAAASSSGEGEAGGVLSSGSGGVDGPEEGTAKPRPARTKWEKEHEQALEAARGGHGPGPSAELECPGCGRGPMALQALQGSCECGAAVCLDCSEGGVVINSCLMCFERCEEAEAVSEVEEGTEVPGPMAFAGTLSGEHQGRQGSRRVSPY